MFGGAGVAALTAGIDIELPDSLCYGTSLLGELEPGVLDEARGPGRSAGPAPEARARPARRRLAPAPATGVDLDSAGNRAIARRLAEQCVVLLTNQARCLCRLAGG